MRRRRGPIRPRKTARRWHIPPPLVHGSEPLEGGTVLEEIQGEWGVLLWQALRDVLLWADTSPEERPGLFAAEAGAARAEALAGLPAEAGPVAPMQVLTAMLERPAQVEENAVAEACRQISVWAEEREARGTALAFAQNTGLVAQDDPMAAYAVARLAARLADHARAEVWFRRAIGIARQAREWRMYARSFSGLGSLYQSRGNLPMAQRFHMRALRGARRGGLRVERAVALHDLFGVAIEMDRVDEADRYARLAFDAYAPRDPRMPVLAHDVAYFWMEHGRFEPALPVFQAVLPLIDHPVERLWVEADLARAAAGAGEIALARQMLDVVWEKCRQPDLAAGAARALLEVGRGALQLGDWDAAETAAAEALRLAGERREGRTQLMAEALLDAVRSARAAAHTPPAPRAASSGHSAADDLAQEMIRTLRELPGTAPAPES